MAVLDLAAAASILKTQYRGPIRDQLNNATILLTRLKRRTEGFSGKEMFIPVRKGRNIGTGARAESGTLPTAGKQLYDNFIYNVVYLYGRMQLTGPTISSMKNDAASFVRAVQSEMEGLTSDVKVDLNRQLWHDGSACLTGCKTTTASTSVEVDSTKFLQVAQPIFIADMSAGTGAVTGRTVSSITDADTFVISGAAVTTGTTDGIFLTDSRDTAAWGTSNFEVWGLEAIVSDLDGDQNRRYLADHTGITNRVGKISRATNTWHRANALHSSGTVRALTLDLMQQAFDKSDIEGDAVPGLILTSHAGKRRYAALLQADKRYPPGGETVLDGGYRALEFNGVQVVGDKDASVTMQPSKLGRLYFLAMSSLEWIVMEDWKFMDEDGAMLSRISNQDAYEATILSYAQLGATRSNANTVLEDIDENP